MSRTSNVDWDTKHPAEFFSGEQLVDFVLFYVATLCCAKECSLVFFPPVNKKDRVFCLKIRSQCDIQLSLSIIKNSLSLQAY